MNFILITAGYVSVAALGMGIFLWGKPDGNSMFDRLYQIVCISLPRLLKKALEKCCGKRAPAFLDWLWNYICFTSNPIVQVFYILVVVGGYITYVSNGYPHMPSRLISGWHRYTGLGVFITCVSVWWKASSADPGIITKLNVDRLCELYPWDEICFYQSICSTCNYLKPARSKHCSLCGVCVARFDHHCIWVNNCIGIGNHKWFLGFLFWHQVLCIYGVYIGLMIIYEDIMDKNLFNSTFVDPLTKERHKASYYIVFQYMLATQGMLIFICILAGVMGVVLCGFFLWHLNLVRTGKTTNEMSKWSMVKWQLKKQEGPKPTLENIYNKGCIENFREVFFNRDVHAPDMLKRPPQVASSSKKVKSGKAKDH